MAYDPNILKLSRPFYLGAITFVAILLFFYFISIGRSWECKQDQAVVYSSENPNDIIPSTNSLKNPRESSPPLWSNAYLSAISPIEEQQDLVLGKRLAANFKENGREKASQSSSLP